MKKRQEEKENNYKTTKRIMIIIIIIIALLSLITSCSCTSNFFGKIGEIFENMGNHTIDPDSDRLETIIDRDLKFDVDSITISLSDVRAKLSYSYKNINPKEFTCSTSDATIATCYVENGYVIINPKKVGNVKVTLSTETNGKRYNAIANVTIEEESRYIKLTSNSSTINMAYSKTKKIGYSLVGITGDVKVSSSDEKIAKVKVEDGVITITAVKPGEVTITVSVVSNGVEYITTHTVTIINDANSNIGKPNGGSSVKPGNPNNPDEPNQPIEVKDDENRLDSLKFSWINFKFDKDVNTGYRINIPSWRDSVKVTAEPLGKAQIVSYTYNGKTYTTDEIKNLKLDVLEGDNKLIITVVSESGKYNNYEVILEKNKSKNIYLKKLDLFYPDGKKLDIKFNKNKNYYDVKVDSSTSYLNIEAVLKTPKKSDIVYEVCNGDTCETYTSLETIKLKYGSNKLNITVIDKENPDDTNTYVVDIYREFPSGSVETDSNLLTLIDSLGKIDFKPDIKTYDITLDAGTKNIVLSSISSSNKATITYTYTYNGKTYTSISIHELSENILLNTGLTEVIIRVTAEDEIHETTYKININVKDKEQEESKITNIVPSIGSLNFKEDTDHYTIVVGEDDESIGFEVKTSNGGKVEYTYSGESTSLDDLKLEPGKNTVIISLGDKSYTIDIIKPDKKSNDSTLIELYDSLGQIKFDPMNIQEEYSVTLDYDTESFKLSSKASHSGATIEYSFKGNKYTGKSELEKVISLNPGEEDVVTVTVTAEDGNTVSVYKVRVKRSKYVPEEDVTLSVLEVNDGTNLYDLDTTLTTNTVTVSSKVDSVKLTAKPTSSKSTIIYNGNTYNSLEEIIIDNLVPGKNEVVFIVKSESGKEQEYKVIIDKAYPVYSIELGTIEKYYLDYNENPYMIPYDVLKDNEITEEEVTVKSVVVNSKNKDAKVSVEITNIDGKRVIRLKSLENIEAGDFVTIKVVSNGAEKEFTINFGVHDYKLVSTPDNITLNYTSSGVLNSDEFILTARDENKIDLFKGAIKEDKNGNKLTLSDEHSSIDIEFPSEYIDVKFVGNKEGEYSLPIEVSIKDPSKINVDSLNIKISGNAYGKTLDDIIVNINFKKNYILTIDPNQGEFPSGTKYSFIIPLNKTSVDLNTDVVEKPFKKIDCVNYKFLGFGLDPNGDEDYVKYDYENNHVIDNITSDLTIYALYSNVATDDNEEPIFNVAWIENVPIFESSKTTTSKGEEKLIYPGITGQYTFNIENKNNFDITIYGLYLKEKTVCVDTDKNGTLDSCLNMGYIVKDDNNYLYSKRISDPTSQNYADKDYTILNKQATLKDYEGEVNKTVEEFDTSKEITLSKNGGNASFTLYWRWLDHDNKVDTLVGNKAYYNGLNSMDTMYSITVGIMYYTLDNVCETDKN